MALVPLKLPKEGMNYAILVPRSNLPNARQLRFFFTRRVGFISGGTVITTASNGLIDNTAVDAMDFAATLRALAPAAYANANADELRNVSPYVVAHETLPRVLFLTPDGLSHNLGQRLLHEGMAGNAERKELSMLVMNALHESMIEVVLLDTETGAIYDNSASRQTAAMRRSTAAPRPRQVTIPAVGSVFLFQRPGHADFVADKAIMLPNIGAVTRTAAVQYAYRLENDKAVTERYGIPWSVYFSEILDALDPDFQTQFNDAGRSTTDTLRFGTAHREIIKELLFDPEHPSTLKERLRSATRDELEELSISIENMFPRGQRATLYLDTEESATPLPTAPAVAHKMAKKQADTLEADSTKVYSPEFMADYIEDAAVKNDVVGFDRYFNTTVRNYDSAAREMKQALERDDGAFWRGLSGEARAKQFFTVLASRGFGAQTSIQGFSDHLYMLSMFCPKADPLGRYILCDMYAQRNREHGFIPDAGYFNPTIVMQYAGVVKQFILGVGGPKVQEADDLYPADGNAALAGMYLRMHSPKGVKVQGFGLGTVLYGGSAVIARMHSRYMGTYSRPGQRSEEAEAWWSNALVRGMTQRNAAWPQVMEPNVTKRYRGVTGSGCVTIGGNRYVYGDSTSDARVYNTVAEAQADGVSMSDLRKGRIKSLCVPFEATFPEWPKDTPLYRVSDMLPSVNVLNAGLIPFIAGNRNTGRSPILDPEQRSSWNSTSTREGQPPPISVQMMQFLALPDAEVEIYEQQRRSERTANMLARASFGPSPRLALMILDTLTSGSHDELARQYLARKDIAALIGTNKTALGVLHSGRLAGLRSMSLRRTKHVLSGLSEGLEPSHDSANPLNIPPMPASMKRELDKLAFD